MQYGHRQDTKTSNKLEVGWGWFDYAAHSLTEMVSICQPPGLPCVRGRGVRWRFGRQIRDIRHWQEPAQASEKYLSHSPFAQRSILGLERCARAPLLTAGLKTDIDKRTN